MVKDRTGGSNQFRVGSGTRILAELEAVCGAWGLPNDEAQARVLAMQKYEELVEDGPVHQCYALICRSFFRVAIEHRLIVWFTK